MGMEEKLYQTKEDILSSVEEVCCLLQCAIDRWQEGLLHQKHYYVLNLRCMQYLMERIRNMPIYPLKEVGWHYIIEGEADGIYLQQVHFDNGSIDYKEKVAISRYPLVSAEQFAARSGCKNGTIRQWVRRGKLRMASKIRNEWYLPDWVEGPSDVEVACYQLMQSPFIPELEAELGEDRIKRRGEISKITDTIREIYSDMKRPEQVGSEIVIERIKDEEGQCWKIVISGRSLRGGKSLFAWTIRDISEKETLESMLIGCEDVRYIGGAGEYLADALRELKAVFGTSVSDAGD